MAIEPTTHAVPNSELYLAQLVFRVHGHDSWKRFFSLPRFDSMAGWLDSCGSFRHFSRVLLSDCVPLIAYVVPNVRVWIYGVAKISNLPTRCNSRNSDLRINIIRVLGIPYSKDPAFSFSFFPRRDAVDSELGPCMQS